MYVKSILQPFRCILECSIEAHLLSAVIGNLES